MSSKVKVKIKDNYIGGGEKILIQSMTNTKTSDIDKTVSQILSLEECGCEIVRVTVNDIEAAKAISKIKEKIHIPLVADIHFDYRLALLAVENGIDKVRINPGNIGDVNNTKKVADACRKKGIPIRIGVNGGSLDKEILKKHGGVTADALVESAKKEIEVLERCDFNDIVLSLKVSDTNKMIDAYMIASQMFSYPLHIGVTEAGGGVAGIVKNAFGIGYLLRNGIGDTLRVSLTDNVEKEIEAAKEILSATGVRKEWVEIISCPTCGRTEVDIIRLADEVKRRTSHIKKHIKVGVMGCVVNGPGEARECDIGIAGGKNCAVLFKKNENGETVNLGKIEENKIVDTLLDEINKIC